MKVIKKLGYRQDFEIKKIYEALKKTAEDGGLTFNVKDWREIKPRIKSRIDKISDGREEIYFWEIDDAVADTLLRSRFNDLAKNYIRAKARDIRDNLNDIGVSPAAMYVLRNRYLRTDLDGNPIETVKEMFARVASEVASVEKTKALKEKYTEVYFNMMKDLDFLPNSPALVSAGSKSKGTYSACVTGDTIIHTTNGDIPIKKLYDNSIENFYVFSCDGKRVRIGTADKVVKTRKDAKVYEIKFDTGYSIKATEDHLIMMRDGEYKRVDELNINDSLMPFNFFHAKKGYRYVFEEITTSNNIGRLPAYALVYKEMNGESPPNGYVIHHKDYSKTNDNPDNLIMMSREEHSRLHINLDNPMKKQKWKDYFSKRMIGNKIAKGIKRTQQFKDNMSINNPMHNKKSVEKLSKTKLENSRKNGNRIKITCPVCNKEFESIKSANRKFCSLKCSHESMKGNDYWKLRKKSASYNHKVISIEYVGKEDVYDIQNVDKYHNFAAEGIFIHNCFAYSIDDSLEDILDTLHKTAKTFQLGGGVGVSIAKLRERGSPILTTNGRSSGSVEFLKLFDVMCTTIKTGGFRRGALMCLTEYNHPDIEWFISCKKDVEQLNNMNISVLVDDKFFEAVEKDDEIDLVSPVDNKVVNKVHARYLLDKIATNIWETGEPGLLFYDRMNSDNPTPHLGDIRVTNPCSESNLLPDEACNLGSINLMRHLNGPDGKDINWDKLATTTENAVRFLDDMIDASPYPTQEVEDAVKRTRKIGVGVMGFADLLIKKDIKYSSDHAIQMAEKILGFVTDVAREASKKLAEEKGEYPAWKKKYQAKRRNAIVTIQAPTGTLSLIAGVSPGIEPNFYPSYRRQIADGAIVSIDHPFKDHPSFETAMEIEPEHHLKMLAKVQENIENSVSKTINAPEHITIEEIKELIIQAWKMKCKGMTLFRENCYRPSLIQGCEECKIERGEE